MQFGQADRMGPPVELAPREVSERILGPDWDSPAKALRIPVTRGFTPQTTAAASVTGAGINWWLVAAVGVGVYFLVTQK